MKLRSLVTVFALAGAGTSFAATGIWGAYLTVDGVKYKSSSTYGGSEPTFNGADLGTLNPGDDTLVLSQAETLTYQNSGHSTFEFALAYRVRLASDPQSTTPGDYTFVLMGDGTSIGGGDEKGEFTGATINLLNGITASGSPTVYAVDIVHKVGAWEGGSNFERLANVNDPNPGGTSWGGTDAFTATFTVVPEPSSAVLGLLGATALLRRRRM